MNLYFIILIILGVGSLIDIFSENREFKRNIYIFLLGILVIFFGTRAYIGYDWYNYKPNFEQSKNILELIKVGFVDGGFEKGYQFYCGVVKLFTSNYTNFSFINTIIDFALIYFIFKRYSNYPILSLFIFFGVYGIALEIDMIRNIKSILLFILSVDYIENRKILSFVALNILGFLFHTSSLLYLPMYFLLKIKWNRVFIFIVFIIGNIYYLSNIRLIINGIGMIKDKIPGGIGDKIAGYISIIPKDFPLGFSLFYLERVILFLIVFLIGKRLTEKRYGIIFVNSLFLSVFIFLYGAELSVISLRIGILFVYSYWFIIPMFFDIKSASVVKLVVFILAILISTFRLDNQLNFEGNKKVYLYETVLLKHKSVEERMKIVEEASKYKEQGHGKELSLLY